MTFKTVIHYIRFTCCTSLSLTNPFNNRIGSPASGYGRIGEEGTIDN